MRLALPVLSIVLLLGCGNPADNVPKAAVSSETNADESASAPAATDQLFAITPKESRIDFIGSKVTGSHAGGFTNFTGQLRVDGGKLAGAGNRLVIDMDSTWSDNAKLTAHLKSPDFFNAPQHPKAEFVTTTIEEKGTNHIVTGNLTLHGIQTDFLPRAHPG